MKQILTGPLVAFDVESTGVDTEQDRIVSACVALLQPAEPAWNVQADTWLIDPGVDVPEAATQVHGFTTAYLKEHGWDAGEAVDQITDRLHRYLLAGLPIVGCNVSFDLTMLDRESRRHGLTTVDERTGAPIAPVVDVYVLDKHLDPYRKGSRRLVELCGWYGVEITGAHDSTFDALAAARVAYRMAQRTQMPNARLLSMYGDPEIRSHYGRRHDPQDIADRFLAVSTSTLVQLHQAQVGWRAEQMRSLREYFAKEGKPVDQVCEAWPVVPFLDSTTEVDW